MKSVVFYAALLILCTFTANGLVFNRNLGYYSGLSDREKKGVNEYTLFHRRPFQNPYCKPRDLYKI